MTTTPTNEAGHGLPELPEPEELLHSPMHGHVYGYTAKQVQQYAKDYAAALALSRGVPADMVLVQKHDLEWIVAHVLDECDATGPCADLAARRVRALIQTAPAAAGAQGEDYCIACKGSGEVMGLHRSPSGDPQDDYEAPISCPKCEGTGVAK